MLPTTLHLLLPFSLLPQWTDNDRGWAVAEDVLKDPQACCSAIEAQINDTPALRRIVRRATHQLLKLNSEEARACAHEYWLAQRFEIGAAIALNKDAPLAPYAALADGVDPGNALWAYVQPVHFELARSHISLRAPEGLDLTPAHTQALFEAAQRVASHYDLHLIAPTPSNWYIRGEALGRLIGSTPCRAEGKNIEFWLPHTDKDPQNPARTWMQFQNEVQMTWAAHPVNIEREAQDKLPANALWLWGQGAITAQQNAVCPEMSPAPAPPFCAVFSHANATRGLGLSAGLSSALPPITFADLQKQMPNKQTEQNAPVLIELNTLMHPALTHNRQTWHTALADIEQNWFEPALNALQIGSLASLTLTLTGENSAITLHLTRADLYKFWRHRTLPTA